MAASHIGRRNGRAYSIDGFLVPSVTEVLGMLGYEDYSFMDPVRLAEYQERGTDVHALTERHDRGELDWADVPAKYADYVEGWERFCEAVGWEPELIEQPVFHPRLMFAGTLDRVGYFRKVHGAEKVLLDIKTGKSKKIKTANDGARSGVWGLQTAGYGLAHPATPEGEIAPDPLLADVVRRYVVQLSGSATARRFELFELTDPVDFKVFEANVVTAHWMLKYGFARLKRRTE